MAVKEIVTIAVVVLVLAALIALRIRNNKKRG